MILDMEERELCQASLQYVFLLQEFEERKKFEFVETVIYFYSLLFFLWIDKIFYGIRKKNAMKSKAFVSDAYQSAFACVIVIEARKGAMCFEGGYY